MFVPPCGLGFERRSFIWTPISIIFENSKLKVGPSWLVYSVSILLLATSIDVHPLLSPPPDTMSTDSLQLSTLPGAHHLQLLSTGQSALAENPFIRGPDREPTPIPATPCHRAGWTSIDGSYLPWQKDYVDLQRQLIIFCFACCMPTIEK